MSQIIVALDVPSRQEALNLVDRLGSEGDFYKVGLELFVAEGPAILSDLRRRGKRVFLDLKLHDIPSTVARAVQTASHHGVELLTVHVSGGRAMVERAVEASDGLPRILGVTVLTSLDPEGVREAWGRSQVDVPTEVQRLAGLARSAGLDGLVASALEARALRHLLGNEGYIVTPGIRPAGASPGDQSRVTTPSEAVGAGADALVVGRPVTRAQDPTAALRAIREEASQAGERLVVKGRAPE